MCNFIYDSHKPEGLRSKFESWGGHSVMPLTGTEPNILKTNDVPTSATHYNRRLTEPHAKKQKMLPHPSYEFRVIILWC